MCGHPYIYASMLIYMYVSVYLFVWISIRVSIMRDVALPCSSSALKTASFDCGTTVLLGWERILARVLSVKL